METNVEIEDEINERLHKILVELREKERHDVIMLKNLRKEILSYDIIQSLIAGKHIKEKDYYSVQETLSFWIGKFIREKLNEL